MRQLSGITYFFSGSIAKDSSSSRIGQFFTSFENYCMYSPALDPRTGNTMGARNSIEDEYVGRWVFPRTDTPLEMVGRKGAHDLDWLADYIGRLLQLRYADRVLDLCCGNGLITVRVANRVHQVVGVDFSCVLLAQAEQISNAENVQYRHGDARAIGSIEIGTFDKIFISAAFQYFDQETGAAVLAGLRSVIRPNGLVAILDIPDRRQKFSHELRSLRRLFIPDPMQDDDADPDRRFLLTSSRLASLARHAAYVVGARPNSDMGWWWRRDDFAALGRRFGFVTEILDQPKENPHHKYRFDAFMRATGPSQLLSP
jgi:SAM-dependent methyltransferase